MLPITLGLLFGFIVGWFSKAKNYYKTEEKTFRELQTEFRLRCTERELTEVRTEARALRFERDTLIARYEAPVTQGSYRTSEGVDIDGLFDNTRLTEKLILENMPLANRGKSRVG